MRLFEHASYPFLEYRRRAYLVTAALLLLGIGSMVYHVAKHDSWLNYGVDFAGGTVVQVNFNRPTTVDQIRAAASEAGYRWEVTRFGSGNDFVLRTPAFNQEAGSDASQVIRTALNRRFAPDAYQLVRTEAVGPRAGAELQRQALLAILVSLLLTLIYIAFRFEWRFGVAAIVATAHDLIVTLGLLALLWNEVSLGTVAAVLTIVGYSLNDTIIVFDRVRENLRKTHRQADYGEIMNRSINETLPRTVLTSGTTLATLFSLYLFGGEVIRPFAQVLIFGIAIGTFSSIFVASPVLYWIERRWPRKSKPSGRPAAATRTRRVGSGV